MEGRKEERKEGRERGRKKIEGMKGGRKEKRKKAEGRKREGETDDPLLYVKTYMEFVAMRRLTIFLYMSFSHKIVSSFRKGGIYII